MAEYTNALNTIIELLKEVLKELRALRKEVSDLPNALPRQ